MSIAKGLARVGKQVAGGTISNAGRMLTLDNPAGWLTGEDLAGMSRERAMKISTVNRCVEVLTTSMAVLPIYVMNEKTKERLSDHRLGRVLWGRANEAMTSFDYQRLMMANQLLRGNAYAWIYRDAGSGHPLELLPLPPDYVNLWTDGAGRLWYLFTSPTTGDVTKLRQEDVLHYKAYTEDGLEGISVLRRASMTLDTARAAQMYENRTWSSGGQPSGVLTTDSDLGGKTTPVTRADGTVEQVDSKDWLRQCWERAHSGAANALRVAVLDVGLKYQPISMTNTDAQFVESNEVRVADICRFFGVPLHLAYAGKQSFESNEQNGIEYVNYTLLGYETQWGQEDSYKLLLPGERAEGQRIKRELKVFLRGDSVAQAAWYRTMREIGPYSTNDILQLEDRPSVPGGDSRYASWNYGPLERFVELSVLRAMSGKTKEEGKAVE